MKVFLDVDEFYFRRFQKIFCHSGLLKDFILTVLKSLQNFYVFYNLVCEKFDNDPLRNEGVYLLLRHCDTERRDGCVK